MVDNDRGVYIRKNESKGNNDDMHWIIVRAKVGENEWWNIAHYEGEGFKKTKDGDPKFLF